MSENKLTELLKSFDRNQLREINAFLSSAQGAKLKNSLSEADKKSLLSEFSGIDTAAARKKIQSMGAGELSVLMRRLGGKNG